MYLNSACDRGPVFFSNFAVQGMRVCSRDELLMFCRAFGKLACSMSIGPGSGGHDRTHLSSRL
jgi:hypothetical protein